MDKTREAILARQRLSLRSRQGRTGSERAIQPGFATEKFIFLTKMRMPEESP